MMVAICASQDHTAGAVLPLRPDHWLRHGLVCGRVPIAELLKGSTAYDSTDDLVERSLPITLFEIRHPLTIDP